MQAPRPLEVLCTKSLVSVKELGKTAGEPVVLQNAPDAISLATIRVAGGLGIIGLSFYFIHQGLFWVVIPALAGFGLFFLGVNQLKGQDRRVRRVRLHQHGFTYQIGSKTHAVAFRNIETASMATRTVNAKGVAIGVFHDLNLSCQEQTYTLSSYETLGGLQPRETDRFALWAQAVVEKS